jgi:hypothetical protein
MALIEMCHDDALSFGDCPINTYEFAVFPHRVDLIQSELVLYKECTINISDTTSEVSKTGDE